MKFEYQESEEKTTDSPEPLPAHENLSEKRYESWAKSLEVILQEVFDFDIPEETIENWKRLGVAMYHIDALIDSREEKERKEIITYLLEALEPSFRPHEEMEVVNSKLALFEQVRENVPPENKEFFKRLIRLLLDVTERIKGKTSVAESAKFTRLEGQITTKLFIALLPPEFQEKEKYGEMSTLLSRIGRIGNVFDTAIDLSDDFKSGQIKISPTLFNRAYFLGSALSEGLRMKKSGTLTLGTIKLFLQGVSSVVRDQGKTLRLC